MKRLLAWGPRPLMAVGLSLAWGAGAMPTANAQMRITEYMYQGAESPPGVSGEFIEFTNVGVSSIDLSGWKFDDNDGPPVDISAFGVVGPDESVILCETTAANFIAAWGLSGVVVIGSNANNLGRNDTIKLLNGSNVVMDQLDYGDQTFVGSIRTNGTSGWPCAQALGVNDIFGWKLSFVGDAQDSDFSTAFNLANPGTFVSFTCPADPTGACCESGVCNIRTQADCTGLGLYQGNGTNCSISCPMPTNAQIRITEYMYGPALREFIEFKNLGGTTVNMSGWSYSDESRVPGLVSLTGFGMVASGAVFVLTENDADDFRDDWSLPGLNVIGDNSVNLGGADEINLYDNSGALVDRLTYGNHLCTFNAESASGWPCPDAVGDNDILEWREAVVGDAQGSSASLVGDVGNPGIYNQAAACLSGSCCVSGVCSIQTQGDCVMQQGLYFGDGTTCVSDPCPPANPAMVRITEFMYQGQGGGSGEFFEITNLGTSSVNLAGWKFEDTCTLTGAFDISGLGILAPGQSGIVTDIAPATFAARWNLSGVPIVNLGSSELGRNDKIILHDADGQVIDRLDYGDQNFPVSVLTEGRSAWPEGPVAGQNAIFGWVPSKVGDVQNSYISTQGEVGNPGTYQSAQLPAVSARGVVLILLVLASAGVVLFRRSVAANI